MQPACIASDLHVDNRDNKKTLLLQSVFQQRRDVAKSPRAIIMT